MRLTEHFKDKALVSSLHFDPSFPEGEVVLRQEIIGRSNPPNCDPTCVQALGTIFSMTPQGVEPTTYWSWVGLFAARLLSSNLVRLPF